MYITFIIIIIIILILYYLYKNYINDKSIFIKKNYDDLKKQVDISNIVKNYNNKINKTKTLKLLLGLYQMNKENLIVDNIGKYYNYKNFAKMYIYNNTYIIITIFKYYTYKELYKNKNKFIQLEPINNIICFEHLKIHYENILNTFKKYIPNNITNLIIGTEEDTAFIGVLFKNFFLSNNLNIFNYIIFNFGEIKTYIDIPNIKNDYEFRVNNDNDLFNSIISKDLKQTINYLKPPNQKIFYLLDYHDYAYYNMFEVI